jgi:hypothetical protein
MKKITPFALSLILSTSFLQAADYKYDCDAAETAAYINMNTVGLQMPSSITKPKEFTEALISTKKEEAANSANPEEEESCFNIWSGDVDLSDDWEKLKKKLSELDFDFSFTSFNLSLDDLLKKLGEEYDKALKNIEEELNKGVCERLAEVNWEKLGDDSAEYFGGKLDSKYGFNPNDANWWESPLKKELNGEMDNLGDYVFDPSELEEDINSDTKRKIKKKDDDFWDDL